MTMSLRSYLNCVSHTIHHTHIISNLLLLEIKRVNDSLLHGRPHLFRLRYKTHFSCRLAGWFPRQLVNYLFEQLCLKAGRALTLSVPSDCVPGGRVRPVISNTTSMVNLSGTSQAERHRGQAALKRQGRKTGCCNTRRIFEHHIAEQSKKKEKNKRSERGAILCAQDFYKA